MKIRYPILIVVTFLFSQAFFSVARADSGYEVNFRVIDAHNAEVQLIYPVSSGMTSITALSSKKAGNILDGHRDLVSAHAHDGSSRTIMHNTLTTDSVVAVQSGDKNITLTYKLTNALKNDDASFFHFLLFFGTEYPATARLKITAPAQYEVLSHSGQSNATRSSDGSITTSIQADLPVSLLSAKNLSVLVYPKSSSSYSRKEVGNFTLIGAGNKINEISAALGRISFAPEMVRKILGVSLPEKISIVAIPVKDSAKTYEPSALALSPSIILIDPNELDFSKGPNDVEKIILHELGHIALYNKELFNQQLYNARWLDEGIAVFVEQYGTDNYLVKDDTSRQIDTVLSRSRKMTLSELTSAYDLSFDYNFVSNTKTQPIDHTYAHAGLIFYNLYLRDATTIPKMLNSLQSIRSDVMCKDCDTDAVLKVMQNVSGLQKGDIVYPQKNNLSTSNTIISRLTVPEVSESVQQKIKQDKAGQIGSYISADAEVEDFVVPGSQPKVTPVSRVPSDSDDSVDTVVNPVDNDEITTAPQSFWQKIRMWFMDLF